MPWKPNVTVAAVIEHENRFLLVEELKGQTQVINQPAGHLEHGETLLQAVRREVLEETGWLFEPESLIGVYLCPASDITYLRFCFSGRRIEQKSAKPPDSAIIQALWLSEEEIDENRPRHRSVMVMQCIRDYRSNKRYPLEMLQQFL